jgi:hypothetical protein
MIEFQQEIRSKLLPPSKQHLMKRKTPFILSFILAAGSASAQGLYYTGSDAEEALPLKWVVGGNVVYDDNVSPGLTDAAGNAIEDSSFAINPYVGASLVTITPQTSIDVYAKLGLIYYFDAPANMDDASSQSRAGSELPIVCRSAFVCRVATFISYELEPDYSYGYASSRVSGEYFYWQLTIPLGYRWSERFATYTGSPLDWHHLRRCRNNDRFTWEIYNQFRYQVSPQTVLTGDYRYAQTAGAEFPPTLQITIFWVVLSIALVRIRSVLFVLVCSFTCGRRFGQYQSLRRICAFNSQVNRAIPDSFLRSIRY